MMRALLFSVLFAASCAEPDMAASRPSVDWEGEHLRIGFVDGETVCGGTRAYLDDYFGALKRRFNAPANLVYDYWIVGAADVSEARCPAGFLGCAVAPTREIFVREAVIEHELVHAARGLVSHDVIEEGAAMVWGDDWLYSFEVADLPSAFEEVENSQRLSSDRYGAAGHFVAFLANEFGSFETFSQYARDADAPESLEVASMANYGISHPELLAEYEEHVADSGVCGSGRYRDASVSCEVSEVIECRRAELEGGFVALFFEFEIDLGCESDDAIGPRAVDDPLTGGAGVTWASRAFHPPFAAQYAVTVEALDLPDATPEQFEGQGDLWIEECAGGCGHTQERYTLDEAPILFTAEPVDYRIRLRQFSTDPASALNRYRIRFGTTLIEDPNAELPPECKP